MATSLLELPEARGGDGEIPTTADMEQKSGMLG